MGFEILELEEIVLKNVADRRRMRKLYCLHKYIDRSFLSLQFLANKLSHNALSYCCTATTGIPSLCWACHYCCHPVIQPFYLENPTKLDPLLKWATENPLLIVSNGLSVANSKQRIFRCCEISNDKSASDFCRCWFHC
jgi:hypothetical protein